MTELAWQRTNSLLFLITECLHYRIDHQLLNDYNATRHKKGSRSRLKII